jgi:hypothetical protein
MSCRGALVNAGQRIHVGIAHAGHTLTVEAADTTWRVHDDGLVAEVACTTTKPAARFKVHRPEPPRRGRPATTSSDPAAAMHDTRDLAQPPPHHVTSDDKIV